MYCAQCGTEFEQNARFCRTCGQPAVAQPPVAVSASPENGAAHVMGGPSVRSGLVGFSDRISASEFTKYKRNSNNWSLIFAMILAVAAVVGFPIYGRASGELEWPESLFYGLGIGGMFLVIAILQVLKRSLDKTWDGTVIDKNSYRVREKSSAGGTHHHVVYVLKVRKDSGGKKKHKWRDIPGPYNYYAVGDKVRHHKGFYYYEKYDKSKDSTIMCTACNSFNEISRDTCERCKCPLLK